MPMLFDMRTMSKEEGRDTFYCATPESACDASTISTTTFFCRVSGEYLAQLLTVPCGVMRAAKAIIATARAWQGLLSERTPAAW